MGSDQHLLATIGATSAVRPISVAPEVWLSARPVTAQRAAVTDADLAAADGMSEVDAQRFLGARGLVRKLIARIRPAAATADILGSDPDSARLAGHADLALGTARDGDWVAAAAGRSSAVGVDVLESVTGTARSPVSERGHATRLGPLPEWRRNVELAWMWTATRACVKAAGTAPTGEPGQDPDIPPFAVAGRSGDLLWRSPRSLSPVPLSVAFAF